MAVFRRLEWSRSPPGRAPPVELRNLRESPDGLIGKVGIGSPILKLWRFFLTGKDGSIDKVNKNAPFFAYRAYAQRLGVERDMVCFCPSTGCCCFAGAVRAELAMGTSLQPGDHLGEELRQTLGGH